MNFPHEKIYRTEKDFLGEISILQDAYYGIHTQRAVENFSISNRSTNIHLIHAIVEVKKAATMAHLKLGSLSSDIGNAIIIACNEVLQGALSDQFILDPLQGGAGTSSHMNVNEVLTNRALELLGHEKGNYEVIHPLHHTNFSQSTNDVYPTALRIAAIRLLRPLSEACAELQNSLQLKENQYEHIIKLGRTQLMDALPMMAGQSFGAYAQAVARDRWRLYKVEERLRQINIGGTAIGTGMNASLKYIYTITDILQDTTKLGLARSEFPMDITQNMDVFVEVSGLLKSAATNLFKIASDLRLLNSGPKGGIGEITLPSVQIGSSIMSGKVNPVIAEMVCQMAMKVMANDYAITLAAMNGQLELNAFTPLIADTLLESLEMMTKAILLFKEKCIDHIEINEEVCKKHLSESCAIATALVYHIGHDCASQLVKKAQKEDKDITAVLKEEKLMSEEEIEKILNPYVITKPGIPGI
ncbi:aspartate ammonia-lyase AnsB [Clostridium aceticum]|uniref:Aspartate ammonia-lyase AnsB n=1 Tax=Clostridium aceticum TaxID=84022 RepID=A0A0D8ID67_9CLOT|nr:aspartate ammonia-lyase [Clostridium aceticum]AKL95160.1 aspartate ammonia-lyase AnsB [Clostridium aceticum]KJF28034.1 aspartate ammonia-lyase [Clostridium aceticum]